MGKTALDDDASIYQKKEHKTEKQKWSEMNNKQRLEYFRDYYLFKLILITGAVALVVFFIWNWVHPREEKVLYVAVVDEQLNTDEKNELQEYLQQRYGADGKYKKVLIDDSFYLRDDALTKMQVYLKNHQIDVIIANSDTFDTLAGYGFMRDMNDILSDEQKQKYGEKYHYAKGYEDQDYVSAYDNEIARGESLAYGIDISQSEEFNKMRKLLNKPVLGIVEGAPNQDNAIDFLNVLFSKEDK